MTKNQKIIKAIQEYKEGYFDVDIVEDCIISIRRQDQEPKFIIFDDVDIYRDIHTFIAYVEGMQNIPQVHNVLRIPYFAGCSGYDLGEFLLEAPGTIDKDLDISIEFAENPVNFNINGLQYFGEYIENIYNSTPVFKSRNNFTDYINYFLEQVSSNNGMINLVLPSGISKLYPDLESIQEIFKNLNKQQETK